VECNYSIKSDGNSNILNLKCGDCFSGASLENSGDCMSGVTELLLKEREIDYVVLKGLVQKEYGTAQTSILKEIREVYEATKGWSSKRITGGTCHECEASRKESIDHCLGKLLNRHPAGAYEEFITYFRATESRCESADSEECVECEYQYVEFLRPIRKIFESKSFFKEIHRRELKVGANRAVYKEFIAPIIRPYFSTSRIMLQPPLDANLVSSYNIGRNIVRIYLPGRKPEFLYFVTPVEYTLSPVKFDLINRARNTMLKKRPQSLDFASILSSKGYIKRSAKKALIDTADGEVDAEEIDELVDILTKHTIGFGILEILLEDENVSDLYINAPANEAPICLNHREYGDCVTNIYLTEDDAEALISKFRSRSGRAFSEAAPVLDLELPEFNTRVAVIGRPLSPDGLAFAIRRQKPTPWTLPQFVSNNTLDSLASGLLSFLIDGQSTILITGSRGSGKTSLLGSLIGEIKSGLRILTIEDTLEIPVKSFNNVGYRIQRLKVGSSVGTSEVEMTPQTALNTALRLGDSVLVIGEVRGPETKILYESMRVGAAGNSVLGTIHGSSTESVFDRVVHDIGIPASSFKATDVVVTVAPIRREGGLKSFRRVLQISEITKRWPTQNPEPTDVFRDLLVYEPQSDKLQPTEFFSHSSELIGSIAQKWNLTYEQAMENIKLRSKMKSYMLQKSTEMMKPTLLELENVVSSNNMLRMLNEDYIADGIIDYHRLFLDWKKWFDAYSKTIA